MARYLLHHDCRPRIESEHDGTFRMIGLYSKNREEWVVTDLGAALTGIAVVTFYDTLGLEYIDYLMNQTELRTLALSSDKIKIVLDEKR